jgi:hypothetical protein
LVLQHLPLSDLASDAKTLDADTGVTEDVDGELSSHRKSEEEADSTGGGFGATLVVTLFLLILTEPASESLAAVKFSSQFFRSCESE